MKKNHQQRGFTLVELAIVLTIVGLLIGGILKGQQLITNAKVTAQMSQVKGIEVAATTFSDTYGALPGDMSSASTRLPGGSCGGGNCVNGDGDNFIGAIGHATPTQSAAYGAGAAGENAGFWLQLSAANLISGVGATTALIAGGALPGGKVGGVLVIDTLSGTAGPYTSSGLYVVNGQSNTTAVLNNGVAAGSGTLTPNQAAQMDRKMDDGISTRGSVIGGGGNTCSNPAGVYQEAQTAKSCNMAWRIQQ